MNPKKWAVTTVTCGFLGLGALAAASGVQADPGGPYWPPQPGPGVNVGGPGNPLPPGRGYLPPPGHGGPMPHEPIAYSGPPPWVVAPVPPPWGAPPPPPTPDWAVGLPVFWDPDLGVWGVWNAPAGVFIRL
jgi:hypothetical protein